MFYVSYMTLYDSFQEIFWTSKENEDIQFLDLNFFGWSLYDF